MKKARRITLLAIIILLQILFFRNGFTWNYYANILNWSYYKDKIFWNYFNEKSKDIAASIIASIILTLMIASLSFIINQIFDGVIKKFFKKLIKTISISKYSYDKKGYDTALNQVLDSLANTKLVFIRVGGFNTNLIEYKKIISNIINDPEIWDYHIYLQSKSSNIIFLEDFFQIINQEVVEIKALTTIQLSRIQKTDFIKEIKIKFNGDITEGTFSDAIIQAIIDTSGAYPKLSDLNLRKLIITKVTLFFNDQEIAHELDILNHQSVATKIIKVINSLERKTETLYIGEQGLEPYNSEALELGRIIYNQK